MTIILASFIFSCFLGVLHESGVFHNQLAEGAVKMKLYTFVEPLYHFPMFTVEVVLTEEEVVEHYWEYHKQGMEASGKVPSRELCIEDFCHNNWATVCEASDSVYEQTDGVLRLDSEMFKEYHKEVGKHLKDNMEKV